MPAFGARCRILRRRRAARLEGERRRLLTKTIDNFRATARISTRQASSGWKRWMWS